MSNKLNETNCYYAFYYEPDIYFQKSRKSIRKGISRWKVICNRYKIIPGIIFLLNSVSIQRETRIDTIGKRRKKKTRKSKRGCIWHHGDLVEVAHAIKDHRQKKKRKRRFVSRLSCFAAVIEIAAANSHLGQVMLHRPWAGSPFHPLLSHFYN